MSAIKVFIRKYAWAVGLFISAAYIIFESLVQHGYLNVDSFKHQNQKQDSGESSASSERNFSDLNSNPDEQKPGVDYSQPTPGSEEKSKSDQFSDDSTKPIVKLEGELVKILISNGFSPAEADQAFNKISETFHTAPEGTDRIAAAIEATGKDLSLTEEKKKALRDSLLSALEETGGSYTYSELEDCVANRIKKYQPDECGKQIVESLMKEVAANLPTDRITPKVRDQLEPIAEKALQAAIKDCNMDYQVAFNLTSIYLQECK